MTSPAVGFGEAETQPSHLSEAAFATEDTGAREYESLSDQPYALMIDERSRIKAAVKINPPDLNPRRNLSISFRSRPRSFR